MVKIKSTLEVSVTTPGALVSEEFDCATPVLSSPTLGVFVVTLHAGRRLPPIELPEVGLSTHGAFAT
jgi:hypothetical protein